MLFKCFWALLSDTHNLNNQITTHLATQHRTASAGAQRKGQDVKLNKNSIYSLYIFYFPVFYKQSQFSYLQRNEHDVVKD